MQGRYAQRKRVIIIAVIIAAAILLGFLVDLVWGAVEKALHPTDFASYIREYAYEYNVPEPIIYAVIKVESGFDVRATSSVGARGLMQMMPETFSELTSDAYLGDNLHPDELYNPEVSIKYGTFYLSYLYSYFEHNWDNALAAYNGGMGNVSKWLANPEYSDLQGNLTYIPFEETRNYVRKVKNEIENYKKLYYQDKEEVKNYEQ